MLQSWKKETDIKANCFMNILKIWKWTHPSSVLKQERNCFKSSDTVVPSSPWSREQAMTISAPRQTHTDHRMLKREHGGAPVAFPCNPNMRPTCLVWPTGISCFYFLLSSFVISCLFVWNVDMEVWVSGFFGKAEDSGTPASPTPSPVPAGSSECSWIG